LSDLGFTIILNKEYMYKPDFIVGDYFFLCQQIVILLSQLKLAAQCSIHKKGGRKTGCGRDGKGEGRGREHSKGMNGRSKSRVNSA